MHKKISFLRVFTETGPLVALAVAIALLVGIVGPASAQFFNFPNFGGPPRPPPRSGGYGGGGGGGGGGGVFGPLPPPGAERGEKFFSTPPPGQNAKRPAPRRDTSGHWGPTSAPPAPWPHDAR